MLCKKAILLFLCLAPSLSASTTAENDGQRQEGQPFSVSGSTGVVLFFHTLCFSESRTHSNFCLAEHGAVSSTEETLPSEHSHTPSLDNAKNVTPSCRPRVCHCHLLLYRLECQFRTNAVPGWCHFRRGFGYCTRTSSSNARHRCRISLGYECSLSRGAIRRYLDEDTRTWRVTAAVLEEIEHDVQSIVNCAEDGDTLLFDVVGTIRPANRVTISKRLTLGADAEDAPRTNNANIASPPSATFECPRDNEGIFSIR